MQHMIVDVAKFHAAFGAHIEPVRKYPPQDVVYLRRSLVAEEHGELWEAAHQFDMVGVADGITDLLYVLSGTAVSFGMHGIKIEGSGRAGIGPPRFPDTIRMLELRADGVIALSRLWLAITHWQMPTVEEVLGQLLNFYIKMAHELNIPLDQCWHEVHSSNMSKMNRPFHGVECRIGQTGRCSCGAIEYRDDGKIKKGALYRPPNLVDIIRRHGWIPTQERPVAPPFDPHRS